MEGDAMGGLDPPLYLCDQGSDVGGSGSPCVDNEIGMNGGYLGSADLQAFEPEGFDQVAGFVGLGIAKHTATAGLLIGLGTGATVEIGAGAGCDSGGIVAVIQAKSSRKHDQGFVLQSALPVAKGQVAGAPRQGLIGFLGVEQSY
jgi:hypothetical protein